RPLSLSEELSTFDFLNLKLAIFVWTMNDGIPSVGQREESDRIFVGSRAVEIAVDLPDNIAFLENNPLRSQLLVDNSIAAIRKGDCPIEAIGEDAVWIVNRAVQRVAH